MSETMVPARFGRHGSKIHLGSAFEDDRGRMVLASSSPACGSYSRPGSGVAMPGYAVDCEKCKGLASC